MPANEPKHTFSKVALEYDAVRPGYPQEVAADFIDAAKLTGGSRVLEIGCGTGQLTRLLSGKGFKIDAIDIGQDLIDIARTHCPGASFSCIAFEDFAAPDESYDAIVSATAFHWLDPATRFSKCAKLLKTGGTLAIIRNIDLYKEDNSPLRVAIDAIYKRVIPLAFEGSLTSLETKIHSVATDFETCGLFNRFRKISYPHSQTFSADEYIRLLDTFSYQHNLPSTIKEELFREIYDTVENFGGIAERRYNAQMTTAHKK